MAWRIAFCEAADLPLAFPGLNADGGDPEAGAEGGVVAAAEEVVGFGEQGADHVEADSGEGEEDGQVAGALVGGVLLGERGQQFANLTLRLGEELVGGSTVRSIMANDPSGHSPA